jgi:hypothetical protein
MIRHSVILCLLLLIGSTASAQQAVSGVPADTFITRYSPPRAAGRVSDRYLDPCSPGPQQCEKVARGRISHPRRFSFEFED